MESRISGGHTDEDLLVGGVTAEVGVLCGDSQRGVLVIFQVTVITYGRRSRQ